MTDVLVVDDDPKVVDMIVSTLSERNYTVRGATDAERALDLIDARKPDVVVSDIDMPGVGGWEFIISLQSSSRTSSLPIVFISGDAGPDSREVAALSGVQEFLSKPFSPSELEAAIRRATTRIQRTGGRP